MNKIDFRYAFSGFLLAGILAGGALVARKSFSVEIPALVQVTGAKVKGPASAPVEVLEYTNFTCPACQKASGVMHQFMARYPGQIRLVFMHFPLAGHGWAYLAHQAAQCAANRDKFWEYHDFLFNDQPEWMNVPENPTSRFLNYARRLGLDVDAFGACLADAKTLREIAKERDTGVARQVNATPTFFINGERMVGWMSLQNEGEARIRKILGLPALPPQPAVSLPAQTSQPAPSVAAAVLPTRVQPSSDAVSP